MESLLALRRYEALFLWAQSVIPMTPTAIVGWHTELTADAASSNRLTALERVDIDDIMPRVKVCHYCKHHILTIKLTAYSNRYYY